MKSKECEECKGSFEPTRKSQRFCSNRCANRHRDRIRRINGRVASASAARTSSAQLKVRIETTKRQQESTARRCQRQRDLLQSKLRSQATEIDRLEAENSEQRLSNNGLRLEVARLKRAQITNVQDLAHIAAWLVSLANAKGVALDPATLEIIRRRGWNPAKRQAGAPRL